MSGVFVSAKDGVTLVLDGGLDGVEFHSAIIKDDVNRGVGHDNFEEGGVATWPVRYGQS